MLMQGLMTALVTPFREGRLDEPALRALVERQIRNRVDALVPCGTTGEAATMTPEERDRVIELTLEVAGGRVAVMAGVGSNDTRATIKAARRAEALGVGGVLVVTPYYNKPPQEGLYQHFRAVAESVAVDVCVYNVPGRTGVHLEPATLQRLAELRNIVAIKEATGDLKVASEILVRCGDRFRLLSGDDFTTLGFVAQGGHGVISVTSNLVPEMMGELVRAANIGAVKHGRFVHRRLFPLFRTLFLESNPIPIKAALSMMGLMTDEVRAPLSRMSQSNRQALRLAMEGLNLLERSA